MSTDVVKHADEHRPTLPEAPVSRIIEYFPPGGDKIIAKDCTYAGLGYSKGSILDMPGGVKECSGDKEGSWKPVKKSP
jgi:hypothetical protein